MFKLFKGLLLCIVLILLNVFTVKTNASNAYFVWEKKDINVPIYSDLEEYKDDYIVKLYVDGKESFDFTVEKEVNCSSYSTVLTNKIGDYTVYYKAISKTHYAYSEVPIVFHVIDVTSPIIKLNSQIIEVEYGYRLEHVNYYSVTDDTCKIDEIEIILDDSNVVYNVRGTYPATITAIDLYGNEISEDFFVKIVDQNKPNIFVLKPLKFSYKEEVNLSEYFLCKDDYDNDITHRLDISGLDTSILGNQEITLSVKDYSSNEITMKMDILVVDEEAPILILATKEIELDVALFSSYNYEFFYDFIFSLKDNYSSNDNLELVIDYSMLKENVADYYIYYSVKDENNNKNKEVLLVKLREFIGPEIIVDDIVEVMVGSDVDLLSLVAVYDKYDATVIKRLSVEANDFDINKCGTYVIKYTCFNTSGIYSEKIITVIVFDEVSDNIENNNANNDNFILYLIIGGVVVIILAGYATFVVIKKKRNNY